MTSGEMVTVYDKLARVVGQADRATVYRDGLWHGSAGVLVRSTDRQRIYVHRRTETKAVFAGMHDCLAGGVIAPGETPEQTAERELAEELGVTDVPLLPLATASWDGVWEGLPMRCHLFAYQARHDGPFRHQADEVAEAWWWTEDELRVHLADPEWPFVPDTRVLMGDIL